MSNKTVTFKINMHVELDFKNMPEEIADQVEELLMKLKTKKIKDSAKKNITRIDVEKVE